MRRWPELPVYVHERGAPHMASPERLVASAARLYGGEEGLARAVGRGRAGARGEPARAQRRRDGARRDFRVEYTPGHASHHVSYLHEPTGTAFVGDVAGVRIPPSDYVIAPTPPPDIDVEAWDRSIDLIEGWDPAGARAHPLRPGRRRRRRTSTAVRASLHEIVALAAQHGQEAFAAGIRDRVAQHGGDLTTQYEQAAPIEHLYLGARRYLDKRAAA